MFYHKLKEIIESNLQDYVLLCGNFNLVLDHEKDCYNYININNPASRNVLKNIISSQNLVDIYRYLHSDKIRYT